MLKGSAAKPGVDNERLGLDKFSSTKMFRLDKTLGSIGMLAWREAAVGVESGSRSTKAWDCRRRDSRLKA